MKCVVCKNGETKIGRTTVTLERDGATLVFKGVPARVCANCGEAYVDGEITASLLQSPDSGGKRFASPFLTLPRTRGGRS
jgi:YgiT-type zinc finger domain-containing protein